MIEKQSKGVILCDMEKLHDIQISFFTKFYCSTVMFIFFCLYVAALVLQRQLNGCSRARMWHPDHFSVLKCTAKGLSTAWCTASCTDTVITSQHLKYRHCTVTFCFIISALCIMPKQREKKLGKAVVFS